jgi:hypothetical protein
MEKGHLIDAHTKGEYFQKRKEKKIKKKKRESFSFRGNCFGGKSFLENTTRRDGDFSKNPWAWTCGRKAIHP